MQIWDTYITPGRIPANIRPHFAPFSYIFVPSQQFHELRRRIYIPILSEDPEESCVCRNREFLECRPTPRSIYRYIYIFPLIGMSIWRAAYATCVRVQYSPTTGREKMLANFFSFVIYILCIIWASVFHPSDLLLLGNREEEEEAKLLCCNERSQVRVTAIFKREATPVARYDAPGSMAQIYVLICPLVTGHISDLTFVHDAAAIYAQNNFFFSIYKIRTRNMGFKNIKCTYCYIKRKFIQARLWKINNIDIIYIDVIAGGFVIFFSLL